MTSSPVHPVARPHSTVIRSRRSLLDTVVVGFDGSTGSRHALDWGGEDARRRGRRLHVIHVWLPPPLVAAGLSFPSMPDSQAILDDAVAQATTSWPEVVVTTQSLPGPVADAFIEASIEADAVVVGAPDRRWRGFRDFSSTAWQVAIHSLCPVVIVPENPDPADHGVVVVGVDGSPGSHHAVEYAFRRAGESDAELVAVYGWHTTAVRSTTGGPERARLHADQLSTWLAPARAGHPDVGVREVAVHADSVAAILQESRQARLVVVGSRGREGVQGMVLGSVGMGLLRESTSPVAIVRA